MRTDSRTFNPDDPDSLIKTQSKTCTHERQSRTWRTERKLDHSRTRRSQDFLTKRTIHWMAARESTNASVHSLYGSPTLVPEPANMQEITSLGCLQLLSAPFPEMCVFQSFILSTGMCLLNEILYRFTPCKADRNRCSQRNQDREGFFSDL